MQWESITVVELETSRTLCDCCGQVTALADGDLVFEEEFVGWFSVKYSEKSSDHPAIMKIYVGDWSEGAPITSRWGVIVSWHSERCFLLDWDEDDRRTNDMFTCLNRDDVLGTDFSADLWAMVDAITMKDTRLQGVHPQ